MATMRGDLHLIVDNYATHKHPKVKSWLKRHPRIHQHFTPTILIGGRRMTSVEAMRDFFAAQQNLSAAPTLTAA